MSRALDKATVAALQSGDPEAAFQAIAGVLTAPAEDRLEIELLGLSHPPAAASTADSTGDSAYFLRDGNAVAVYKLALVQAFFVARRMLQRFQTRPPTPPPDDMAADAMAATAVILLFDPEHLTAANTRKRILLARPPAARAAGLAAERRFVDSLLTSHLHRHTKSPTLWNQRRWLVQAVGVGDEDGSGYEAQRADLADVVDVVTTAAARHPRNYYAWDHARWLVARHGSGPSSAEEGLLPAVFAWCRRHHDDTSGWSFLLFLLQRPAGAAARDDTLAQVEQLAASMRWTGESVWVFLRTATAVLEHGQTRLGRLQALAARLQSGLEPAAQNAAHQDWRVLQQTQEWCARCAQSSVRTYSVS